MKLTQAATKQGEAAKLLGGVWTVADAAGEPPQRYFRQVLYLRFETGGSADRIAFDAATTVLAGAFKPYTYDALTTGVPALLAQVDDKHGGAIVILDAPRRIAAVKLSSGVSVSSAYPLGLHRLDGQAVSEQATVTTPSDLIYVVAVDEMQKEQYVYVATPAIVETAGAAPAALEAAAAAPAGVAVAAGQAPQDTAVAYQSLSQDVVLPQEPEFTDIQFVLRVEGMPAGTLKADNVWGISVKSSPAAPRLGLASPDRPDEVAYFWPIPAPPGQPADPGAVTAGSDLAQALSRYVEDLAVHNVDPDGKPLPLPATVDIALVIASDAPCEFRIDKAEVEWRLVQESFPDRSEKQVLRFAGDRIETQQVAFDLPARAGVKRAVLEVAPGLRAGQQLPATKGEFAAQVPTGNQGAYLGRERWIAQRLAAPPASDQAAASMAVSSLALGLMALVPKTELLIEVREDGGGQPSGRRLAAGPISLNALGAAQWAVVLFKEPVVLPSPPSPPAWLLVKAGQGQALWLAEELAPGGAPLRVLEQHGPAAWSELSVLGGLQGQVRPFVSGPAVNPSGPALTLAVSGDRTGWQPAPLQGSPCPVAEGEKPSGNLCFDLAAALTGYLADYVTTDQDVTVSLELTSGMAGLVTVYPPQVEYDLPPAD